MSTPQSDNVLHAISGAGGGVLSMVLTYPLITLSTRAQVESKRAHSTVLDATQRIIAREGIAGLYAGLDSAVFGISVTNFVYYYWYEWTRSAFETAALRAGRSRKLSTLESMIAGAVAGSATVLITNPIWVVNTRMTARKRSTSNPPPPATSLVAASAAAVPSPVKSKSTPTLQDPSGTRPRKATTLSEIKQLLKEGGPKAFFAGVLPALILVINPILQYTIFEQLKNALERRRRRRIRPSDAFWLGALGKLVATALTYPYITVKARAHVGGDKKDRKGEGVFGAMRRIVREEGWMGLYGGIGPKLCQSVLTAAFLFMLKDAIYNITARALLRRRAGKLIKAA